MIIVSQDKDTIINFDNIESIDIVADLDGTGKVPYKLYCETSTKREELGKYATEERAKEVLIEIIQSHVDSENYKYVNELMKTEELNRLQKGLVYEMPKE